jgi:hypothetical protein
MRQVAGLVALCACCAALGCASSLVRPTTLSQKRPPSARAKVVVRRAPAKRLEQLAVDWAADAGASTADQDPAPSPDAARDPALVLAGYTEPTAYTEEVAAPRPTPVKDVTTADDAGEVDVFAKRIAQVPLDIRPPQGELPTDMAAAEFAESPETDFQQETKSRPELLVSWTPWTLCFRPLYFEEVGLERYGCSAGPFQSSISAARFFFGVGLLPYKEIARLPRSCVCSNGFSRCGDVPLPGYLDCRFHLDGAAFEAAALTAIVLSLP